MTRRSPVTSLVALAALSLASAACSLPGGGGVGGAPGGVISVSSYAYNGGSTASASAFFIARLDTSNGSVLSGYDDSAVPDQRTDTCEILEPIVDPVPVAEGLDVGATVVLETGLAGQQIIMQSQSEGQYAPIDTVLAGIGKDYAVTIAGNDEIDRQEWEGALHLPDRLALENLFSGNLVLDDAAATEVTWDSTGADAMIFTFSGSTTGICVAKDDGSFEIPVEFAGDLDTSGPLTVVGISESKKSLGGRAVRLVGASGYQAYFSVGAASPGVAP